MSGLKFTGRTLLIIMSDQENAVKNLVDMIRQQNAGDCPKGSSASAGGIERGRETDQNTEITV